MRSTIRRTTRRRSERSGETWREVITVVSLVGLIASLFLPLVLRHREAAREQACRDNLRAIGVSLLKFSDHDPKMRLSTGAFDMVRDGSPDEFGWPADMAATKTGSANALRCPANPVRGLETLNDIIGTVQTATGEPPAARRGIGFCATLTRDPGKNAAILGEQISQKGINTNYASSWHMVRGEAPLTHVGTAGATVPHLVINRIDLANIHGVPIDLRDLRNVDGPLTVRRVEQSTVPSANIAMLGDAAPAPGQEGLLSDTVTNGGMTVAALQAGSRLGRSFNGGPAFWDRDHVQLVRRGAEGTPHAIANSVYNVTVPRSAFVCKSWPTLGQKVVAAPSGTDPSEVAEGDLTLPGASLILQDMRAWGAPHAGNCNLLMSDGSVRKVADLNGDGLLNPGFPATGGSDAGYRDGTVEINPFEVYPGTVLTWPDLWQRWCCE